MERNKFPILLHKFNIYRFLKGDQADSLEEKKDLVIKMKERVKKQKDHNQNLANEVKKLRKRELEIIKRWDLDDINLITERLNFEKSTESSKSNSKSLNCIFRISQNFEEEKERK